MDYPSSFDNIDYNNQASSYMESGNDQTFPARSMMEPPCLHSNNFEPQSAPPYATDYQHPFHDYDSIHMPDQLAFGAPAPEYATYQALTIHQPPDLQTAYNAYVASHNNDATSSSIRMSLASSLALALLSHYYPSSEGYIIQATSHTPMTKHGLYFMLKTADGASPEYHPLAPLLPLPAWKDPKKGKNKAKPPSEKTLAQREKRRAAEECKRQFGSWWSYTCGVQWHFVEPEEIAGFEVLKQHNGVEGMELRLHTYLAIVLAPPDLISRLASTNDIHRADVLADALSRSHDVQVGHGMLLFGPWLKLYDFDNGRETQVAGTEEDEYYEGMVSCEDPMVSLCRAPNGQGLAIDLREVGMGVVDEVCGMVVGRDMDVLEDFEE